MKKLKELLKMPNKYKAVDVTELRNKLGNQCSPQRGKDGYVIGPDVNGRICHCATCGTFAEAKRIAHRLNEACNCDLPQV